MAFVPVVFGISGKADVKRNGINGVCVRALQKNGRACVSVRVRVRVEQTTVAQLVIYHFKL